MRRFSKRIKRLEAILGSSGQPPKWCHTCGNGRNRSSVTLLTGYPGAPPLPELDPNCPRCGREVIDICIVHGIDPAKL